MVILKKCILGAAHLRVMLFLELACGQHAGAVMHRSLVYLITAPLPFKYVHEH